MLVDAGERTGFLECLYSDSDLGLRLQIGEIFPSILHELRNGVTSEGNGQCGERDGEPAVRRPQKDRSGPFLTAHIILIHVRMTTATTGQVVFSRLAERLSHIA